MTKHNIDSCDMPGCGENGYVKVYVTVDIGKSKRKLVRWVCEGHAFILLGKEGTERIIQCPVCRTQFGVM